MSARLTLVLGGIRSGKSAFAESLVPDDGRSVVYVATGQAGDEEMSERIRRHRDRRPSNWQTLEAPLDPGAELSKLLASSCDNPAVLVDSLDVWLANLLLEHEPEEFSQIENLASAGLEALLSGCREADAFTVLVSSEVGLSPVSPNRLGRRFQDLLGTANQRAAAAADQVYLVVAGIPMQIKP
ncbi:MAG: bifunctional adenosylcobinamide kinase/adenosylcobinamide-phosphate guanylyltransferase [Chloroflexi bacterium]|nr:bifunctional adenosylcobinamide kinase/adenosylcobinamide-phosphate guanylyltransferase [Chloroflexota bacterium]